MACLIEEKIGSVLVLTLNRPEARNAMSPELVVRLDEACERAKTDESIRAVIIAASDGDTFCAGGDLKLMIPLITGARKAETEYDKAVLGLMKAKERPYPIHGDIGKPLIAAIEGAALGGGLELALACDMIVVGPGAMFAAPEAAAGAYPARITYLLPQRIPYSIASSVLLAGSRLSAADAAQFGLATSIAAKGEALDEALRLANRIGANAPVSVQCARNVARAALSAGQEEVAALDRKMTRTVYATEDAREGPRAFREKRKPQFKGR